MLLLYHEKKKELHNTTSCYNLSLWQCFEWYICICILNCTVKPLRQGEALTRLSFLDIVALWKGSTLKCSPYSQNGLLSLVDWFYRAWSVVLFWVGFFFYFFASHPFCCKRSWCLSSVYPHRNFTMTFVFLFCTYKIHISFLSEDQCFLQLIQHSIYPIWSLSFQIFGHYSPLFKKRAYWKKRIKQLWFLKCTVVCLYSLCNAVILAVLDKRNRVNNTVHFVTDVTLLGPAPQLAVKITHGDQRAGGRESMISPLFTAFCWSWLQTGPNTF